MVAGKENESASVPSGNTNQHTTLMLTPTNPVHKCRTFKIIARFPVAVGKQHKGVVPATTNVVIADKSVQKHHASIALVLNKNVEIRDEGTTTGTFLNRHRLSCNGVVSPCYRLNSGDIIVFGTVEFRVDILNDTMNDSTPILENETIEITLRSIAGDVMPQRNVVLTKNVIQKINRATKSKPPLRTKHTL